MRYLTAVGICCVLLNALSSQNVFAEAAAADTKALQGTWTFVVNNQDGKSALEDAGRDTSMKVEGSKITFFDKNGKRMHALVIEKVDASTSPQTIVVRTEGDKPVQFTGIFKVDRNTMELCLPMADSQPKPDKLAPGDFVMYLKMTRN